MAHALSAWAINRGGKNSVRNLRYGPRTRLVRGIYRLTSKRLLFHHALKIQRKTVVQTKLNKHVVIVFLLYLFAAHAGIQKDTID